MINPIELKRKELFKSMDNQFSQQKTVEIEVVNEADLRLLQKAGKIQIFDEAGINKFMSDMKKGLEHNKVTVEDLEKAKKDLAKLQKKIITNKNGQKQTVYVKTGAEPKKDKTAKKDDGGDKKKKSPSNTLSKEKEKELKENPELKKEFTKIISDDVMISLEDAFQEAKYNLGMGGEDTAGVKDKKGDGKVTMDAKELVDEHEKLIDTMKSPSKKDDKKEIKKQEKELKDYKKEAKEGGDKKEVGKKVEDTDGNKGKLYSADDLKKLTSSDEIDKKHGIDKGNAALMMDVGYESISKPNEDGDVDVLLSDGQVLNQMPKEWAIEVMSLMMLEGGFEKDTTKEDMQDSVANEVVDKIKKINETSGIYELKDKIAALDGVQDVKQVEMGFDGGYSPRIEDGKIQTYNGGKYEYSGDLLEAINDNELDDEEIALGTISYYVPSMDDKYESGYQQVYHLNDGKFHLESNGAGIVEEFESVDEVVKYLEENISKGGADKEDK